MSTTGYPAAHLVAEEFNCSRTDGLCQSPSICWTRGHCFLIRQATPHPKRGQRKKDSPAIRKCVLRHPECACGARASDGHHVLWRSHGGDDVIENIAPLCHDTHMDYHNLTGEAGLEVKALVGEALRDETIKYVLDTLGQSAGAVYLWRHYRRRP